MVGLIMRYIVDACPETVNRFCVWDTQDGPGHYRAVATGFDKDHAEAFANNLNNPAPPHSPRPTVGRLVLIGNGLYARTRR